MCIFYRRGWGVEQRARMGHKEFTEETEMHEIESVQHFKLDFKMVEEVTNNFSNILGEGGFGKVFKPHVPYRQYYGYIPLDMHNTRYLFFYFMEDESDSASKPVVLWLNGILGWSSENSHSWNQVANMIYLEPSGFIYSLKSSDQLVNDERTTRDNLAFLKNWLKKFLTIAIANSLLDFNTTYNSVAGFYWSHGVISEQTFDLLTKVCNYSQIKIEQIYGGVCGICKQDALLVGLLWKKYWSSCTFHDDYDLRDYKILMISKLGTLVKAGLWVLTYRLLNGYIEGYGDGILSFAMIKGTGHAAHSHPDREESYTPQSLEGKQAPTLSYF
ncbi:serine carboxypeptidase-like protein [Medicago truncatula]|uniref:Serine carboxypeptidase-like protein n=1 Tax=Medicago truncatula TaxID=3880 RepID=G7L1P4_MEDTR|nr:serine carboxypeptidase-like protein [Medicago truncatula]